MTFIQYSLKNISISVKEIMMEEKEMPSVTICPRLTFKKDLDGIIFNSSTILLNDLKNLIRSNLTDLGSFEKKFIMNSNEAEN